MNELDIGIMPSKTMLVVWLKQLVASGLATFENHSNKIISLSSSTSNCFAIGFLTSNLHPILGVPQAMTPWLDIFRIYTSNEDHCIYIAFGENDAQFYLKIKSNKDRIKALTPEEEISTDLIRTIDIVAYKLTGNSGIQISRSLNRVEILEISSIDLLIPKPPAIGSYFMGIDQDDETGWLENAPFLELKDPLPEGWEKSRTKLLGL